MATYTRTNAWNNSGTFANTDLLWYAKGVGTMQARALDDEHSWWFFAAIHGEYVLPGNIPKPPIPSWKTIPAPPAVPTAPEPAPGVWKEYWDQCQHQSWYFPPWHRGYLIALEAHIRAAVVSLGGPSTWALPYWNYFGPGGEFNIPPAFTQQTLPLPGGGPNPLYVKARYGPEDNGKIYIPIPPVSQDSMSDGTYAGDSNSIPPGFGGPVTKFSHGGTANGGLENNPHNLVHGAVGGGYGLMSYPALAALDPIFYLHHANIDRMWAIWNQNSANTNPTDPKWLNGPAAAGDRKFVMPMPDGSSWVYTPTQMTSLSKLDYTYDNLPAPPAVGDLLAQRLTRLGATAAATRVREGAAVTTAGKVELVGASQTGLPIRGSGASTSVKLDAGVRNKVSASLARAAEAAAPDRVYLKLENVRGTHDASILSVYINLPDGAKPSDHPELLAGSVGLFGLHDASLEDGKHGGQGLDFVLEITKIVDALHLKDALDVDSLSVRIVPYRPIPDNEQITVGRVSIYRREQLQSGAVAAG
jgi:tyrosinase